MAKSFLTTKATLPAGANQARVQILHAACVARTKLGQQMRENPKVFNKVAPKLIELNNLIDDIVEHEQIEHELRATREAGLPLLRSARQRPNGLANRFS